MESKKALSLLREHRPDLTQIGVKSLAVFGSVARGEARPDSDVDILVEFEGRATFDRFMDTRYYLEELLGCKVDLVMPGDIKPRLKHYIMQDLIYVT
jgi:predicted nucleotidyltransferase